MTHLALPWFLPHDAAGAALFNSLHPRCIDCERHPPATWSVAQVASQVQISGMQDRDGAAAAARFEAARIDGGALLRLNGSALRDELGLAAAVVRTLEPWLISLRTDAGEARWSTGVHCCVPRASHYLASRKHWAAALRLRAFGPIR